MSDINPLSSRPHIPLGETAQPTVTANGVAAPVKASALSGKQILERFSQFIQNLQPKGKETALSNANGAPKLPAMNINFSAEDLTAILVAMQGKTQDAQMRTASEGLKVSKNKLKAQHEKNMQKITEWADKVTKAAKKSLVSKIFGWVTKIATVVASAIATVALTCATGLTAGAAAPLLALAVLGLVGSTMSLASAISQELGGPPLELSALTTMACKAFLSSVGVPKDKLDAAAKLMGGALAMGLVPGSLVLDPALMGNVTAGIASLGGASATTAAIIGASFTAAAGIGVAVASGFANVGKGVGDAAKAVMETVNVGAKIAQAAAQGTAATSTIISGSLDIAAGVDQHKAESAQADRQRLSAMMVKLQAQMQEDSDQIKKLVQQLQDSYSVATQMFASANESRLQISQNLGQRSMA